MFVRTSQIDSASFCFQRAFEYASRGGKRESLPDICLNLADVFVKQGRYDLGSFWYNRSLSISDSLNMPDEQRFPAYYGLAQVNMELRDLRCAIIIMIWHRTIMIKCILLRNIFI